MIRPIASRLTTITNTGAVLKRNASVIVGPPTKTIPAAEKFFLAGLMFSCWVFTPAYVLTNLKHYKAPK